MVESEEGVGSKFSLHLSLEAPADQADNDDSVLRGVELDLYTDDPYLAEVLPSYLGAAGAVTKLRSKADAEFQEEWTREELIGFVVPRGRDGSPLLTDETSPAVRSVAIYRGNGSEDIKESSLLGPLKVSVSPLRYEDLVSCVAIGANLLSVEELVRSGDRRDTPRRVAPSTEESESVGRLVLVAEDDEINREVLCEQLQVLGYACIAVENGLEALELFEKRRFALVLTDYHMPGMDGFGLTEAIRSGDSGSDVPIVMVTSNAMPGEEERCLDAGMDAYLIKPVRLDILGRIMERWLPIDDQLGVEASPGNKLDHEKPSLH